MAPKPARASGFTLLEVLVGLAIFSVLMVSLYSGYRMGMRSWEAGEAQVDDANQMRVVSGFIRSHLTRAYPVSIREDNKWELQFEGEKERLAFVTEVPGHLGLGGLHQVIIEIDGDDEDDRRLKLTRKLFHPDVLEEDDADESSQIHEAMLIDDLVGSQIQLLRRGARPRSGVARRMGRTIASAETRAPGDELQAVRRLAGNRGEVSHRRAAPHQYAGRQGRSGCGARRRRRRGRGAERSRRGGRTRRPRRRRGAATPMNSPGHIFTSSADASHAAPGLRIRMPRTAPSRETGRSFPLRQQ